MEKVMSMSSAIDIARKRIKSAGGNQFSITDNNTGERRYYNLSADDNMRRKIRDLRALYALYLIYGGARVKHVSLSDSLAQPGSLKDILRFLIDDVERAS